MSLSTTGSSLDVQRVVGPAVPAYCEIEPGQVKIVSVLFAVSEAIGMFSQAEFLGAPPANRKLANRNSAIYLPVVKVPPKICNERYFLPVKIYDFRPYTSRDYAFFTEVLYFPSNFKYMCSIIQPYFNLHTVHTAIQAITRRCPDIRSEWQSWSFFFAFPSI